MPTIEIAGFKFRFYSVEVAYNKGYNTGELNRIVKLTRKHQARLLEVWHAYFDKA